jgi:hypothetical protein
MTIYENAVSVSYARLWIISTAFMLYMKTTKMTVVNKYNKLSMHYPNRIGRYRHRRGPKRMHPR